MFIIKVDRKPVMDWSTGQPRVFETREEAQLWAELSHYHRPVVEERRP